MEIEGSDIFKNLPNNWQVMKINDIIKFVQFGYTAKASRIALGPKFLRITDIQNEQVDWNSVPYCNIKEYKKYLLKPGDIVFARTGATVGKSYLIKDSVPEAIFASYLIRIRFLDFIYEKFVYYYFKSLFYWSQIYEEKIGIGQPNVNSTKLKNIQILIPSKKEQISIVNKLDEVYTQLNAGVATLKQTKEQLQHYRQSILKAAFEGKLTEKWRKKAKGNFPYELEKIDLRKICIRKTEIDDLEIENYQIPSNWVCTKLGNVFSFEYGKGLRKDKRDSDGKIPVFGSNGIVGRHSESLVKKPSVIVGRKGAAGSIHLAKSESWPIDTTYFVIPPEKISLNFTYYLLLSLRLNRFDRSTAIPGLNRDDAYALNIFLPPFKEQDIIVDEMDRRYTIIEELANDVERNIIISNRLKQSILKTAFEGKLVSQILEKKLSEELTKEDINKTKKSNYKENIEKNMKEIIKQTRLTDFE